MSRNAWTLAACTVLALGAHARAQDPEAESKSVEGRLLEILKQRGVITEGEFTELRQLEGDLRKESELESRVDRGVDEMISRLADDAPKVSYKPGSGFTFKAANGMHSLTVGGRIQVRATYEAREDENGNQNDEDLQNFNVQRARVWFKGFAFDPSLRYELQIDVAGDTARPFDSAGTGFDSADTSSNRLVELKFAYVDWQICDEKPWFNIRAGHFKTPYSRELLTSSGKLQFVDRSPVTNAFAPQFSYGVMFWGTRGGEDEKLVEYSAGVFNGSSALGIAEGENILNNDDGLLYVARVAVNPFGELPYSEGDLRACAERDDFKMAVGVNAWYHQDNNRSTTLGNFDDWAVGADLAMAWRGLFFYGELGYRHDAQPNSRPDVEAIGWNAQVGYMLVPQRFEVGLRYAEVGWEGTTAMAPATVPTRQADREYLAMLGYYWHEHNMKLQLDFGRVEIHEAAGDNGPSGSSLDGWRARLQFQVVF